MSSVAFQTTTQASDNLANSDVVVGVKASLVKMETKDLKVFYGEKPALKGVDLEILPNRVTALIGPSGCGKSTYIRSLNRMNDIITNCRVEGSVLLDGEDIYEAGQDVVRLRSRIGMVFQKPNLFPQSIYDNVAYGPSIHGMVSCKEELDQIVRDSLTRAGLWDEISDLSLIHI